MRSSLTKQPNSHHLKGDLTKGNIRSHLIRLTIPMIWGILSIISFQLVDTYFISLLGTQSLAAISFTFPVTMVIFSILMGFGIAMSSVISRLIGEGNNDDVKRVTTHGLALVFIVVMVISMLGFIFQDTIFHSLGADQVMRTDIRQYMDIWFMGIVFLATPLVGNAAIRAKGDTATPAFIMIMAALLNLILDPLLIFGLFGFPRLELQGAAIATVLSNAAAMILGLYVLHFKKKMLCTFRTFRFDLFFNSTKRLLVIALPAGITNAIQPFVNSIIIALLSSYGAEAVAAYGIVSRIEAFAFIILMAMAVGMGPIIGQNWGAKNYDRVHQTLRQTIQFNVIWSLFIALILGVFARQVASVFSDDPLVIDTAALFFWLVPFSYAFSNLINGWASAFNAMGMPQRSFVMIVIKMLLLLIPAIFIGNEIYQMTGIFIAIAAVNVFSGIAFHLLSWHACKKCECQPKIA